MPEELVLVISEGLFGVAAGFSILFSLLNCFFGYKLRKLWIALFGFLLGFFIGFAVVTVAAGGGTAVGALIGAAAGLLCGLLAYKIYRLGMFLWCAGCTFTVVCPFIYQAGGADWLAVTVGLLAGLVVGVLVLKFMRAITIATTAVSGGWNAARQTLALFSITDLAWTLPVAVLLVLLGIAVQLKTTEA